MSFPARHIILNEINNVIIALRTNSRFSSRARFQYEIIRIDENKLLVEMKTLRDLILSDFNNIKLIDIFKPFFGIIESEETTGPITGVALNSIKKFIKFPQVINNHEVNDQSEMILNEVVKCVKRCQFEQTDITTDESVLVIILEVFLCCIKSPGGSLLSEQIVFDIFKSCFRIGRETRPSENLKRNCEKILEIITEIVFQRVLQMDNDNEKEKENEKENEKKKKKGKNWQMAKVFRFICDLSDPTEGKAGSLRLLGLTLANLVLEIFGKDIKKFDQLLNICKNSFLRALLRNSSSNNTVILSQTLRGFENCVISLPKIHEQIESFIITTHLRIADCRNISHELQELVLESLIDLCSIEDFSMYLYRNFDCCDHSSNLLENIVKFLSKNVKQSESLNSLHILSFKSLLQIVNCLYKRCSNNNNTFEKDEIYLNKQFQEYRKKRTRKYKMMEISDKINQNLKEGLKMLIGSEFVKEETKDRDIARFLFNYNKWLNKFVIGDILREKKFERIVEEYMNMFDFKKLRVDEALRHAVYMFHLHGESQQVTSVLSFFTKSYYESNPGMFDSEDTTFKFAVWIMMLHTDCHNKTGKRGINLEKFIETAKETIFNESANKVTDEELELIYYDVENNEMHFASNKCEEFKTDSIWKMVLEKSSVYEDEDIKTTIYDYDLFESIWGSIAVAIRIVLENSRDGYIVDLAISGFKKSAKIASYYKLTKVLDNIVISLCKFTLFLSPKNENSVAQFGSNPKAMLALNTVISITRNYGDTLREGWKNILNLVIRIYELGLLPFKEDSFLSIENYYYKRRIHHKTNDTPSGSSWFGLWPTGNEENVNDNKNIISAEKSIDKCRIPVLLNEVKYLDSKSLEYLVKGLINNKMVNQIYTITLCLKVLVEITVSKSEKILHLWKYIHEHIEHLLKKVNSDFVQNRNKLTKRGFFLLENYFSSIFKMYTKLVVNVKVHKSLNKTFLLLKLPSQMLQCFSKKISENLLTIIKENGKLIKDKQVWDLILIMCRECVNTKESTFNARALLSQMVIENLCTDEDNLTSLVSTLLIIFKNEIEVIDLLSFLHDKYLSKTDQLINNEKWRYCWLFILKGFVGLCIRYETNVGTSAVNKLQRIFLDPSTIQLPVLILKKCLDEVLFVLMDKLLSQKKVNREIRLKASSLLSKTFLHFLAKLVEDEDKKILEESWMKVLGFMKKCVNTNCEYLIESTPQLLKNMILVMKSQNVLKEEMWVKTDELLKDNVEMKKIIDEISMLFKEKEEKIKKEKEEEIKIEEEKAKNISKEEKESDVKNEKEKEIDQNHNKEELNQQNLVEEVKTNNDNNNQN